MEALLVSCADKLHNARAIVRDREISGDAVWDRFNASRAEVVWYYERLVEAFLSRGVVPEWMIDELARLASRMADG